MPYVRSGYRLRSHSPGSGWAFPGIGGDEGSPSQQGRPLRPGPGGLRMAVLPTTIEVASCAKGGTQGGSLAANLLAGRSRPACGASSGRKETLRRRVPGRTLAGQAQLLQLHDAPSDGPWKPQLRPQRHLLRAAKHALHLYAGRTSSSGRRLRGGGSDAALGKKSHLCEHADGILARLGGGQAAGHAGGGRQAHPRRGGPLFRRVGGAAAGHGCGPGAGDVERGDRGGAL